MRTSFAVVLAFVSSLAGAEVGPLRTSRDFSCGQLPLSVSASAGFGEPIQVFYSHPCAGCVDAAAVTSIGIFQQGQGISPFWPQGFRSENSLVVALDWPGHTAARAWNFQLDRVNYRIADPAPADAGFTFAVTTADANPPGSDAGGQTWVVVEFSYACTIGGKKKARSQAFPVQITGAAVR